MASRTDDRRAALIVGLGLTAAQGAALSITDLETLYNTANLAGGEALPVDGPWIDMVIIAPWIAGVGVNKPQYTKNNRGVVRCRGQVTTAAASGGTPFTLMPPGYRITGGSHFFNAWAGGTPLNPTTALTMDLNGNLNGGYTNTGTPAADGTIVNLVPATYSVP
jgi:hypothetical protein